MALGTIFRHDSFIISMYTLESSSTLLFALLFMWQEMSVQRFRDGVTVGWSVFLTRNVIVAAFATALFHRSVDYWVASVEQSAFTHRRQSDSTQCVYSHSTQVQSDATCGNWAVWWRRTSQTDTDTAAAALQLLEIEYTGHVIEFCVGRASLTKVRRVSICLKQF